MYYSRLNERHSAEIIFLRLWYNSSNNNLYNIYNINDICCTVCTTNSVQRIAYNTIYYNVFTHNIILHRQ